MNPLYPAVAARARHRCEYCCAPEAIFNLSFEVEHVLPRSLGGDDDPNNLALSCRACNLRKAARTSGYDEVTRSEHRLFDPRRHRWDQHFRLDTTAGLIEGITEIGRATVAALQFNSDAQTEARRFWIGLGLLS